MHKCNIVVAALAAGWVGLASAQADENMLAYSYGSETLPKGKWELYQWATARVGKEKGDYLGLDLKTEIEYGITDRLQTSLYLNNRYHHIKDAEGSSETFDNRNGFNFDGVQTSFKYSLLSPYKDGIGLAVYLEPGYSRVSRVSGEIDTEYELEYKVILQKNFLDDTLIAIVNLTGESEWEKEGGHDEFETALKLELSGGVSYRLAANWFAGIETRIQGELEEYEKMVHATWYLGPSIHYAGQKWWATLAVLPQVAGWPDSRGMGGLHLDDNEKLEVRLKVGYNF